ncbi:hypothetical protein AMTR_s00057p00034960, partial [Amborella trichopoda]
VSTFVASQPFAVSYVSTYVASRPEERIRFSTFRGPLGYLQGPLEIPSGAPRDIFRGPSGYSILRYPSISTFRGPSGYLQGPLEIRILRYPSISTFIPLGPSRCLGEVSTGASSLRDTVPYPYPRLNIHIHLQGSFQKLSRYGILSLNIHIHLQWPQGRGLREVSTFGVDRPRISRYPPRLGITFGVDRPRVSRYPPLSEARWDILK